MGTFAEANNERRKYTGLSDRRWERARWALAEHIDAFNPISVSNRARDNAENVLQLCAPAPGVEG